MPSNKNVLFSDLPKMNIQRSIFDMPQDIKTTANVGELVPFFCMECLPSDSIKIRTNKVIRLQTPLTPIMDNLYADFMYFYVPNRLVWTHWKQFMGENTDSAYLPEVTYRPPRILAGNGKGTIQSGDVLDYFGLPLVTNDGNGITPIAFPYRGYQLIWNEFFRDQNLQDPVNINMGDSDTVWSEVSSADKRCLPVNKLHDYFTSCLRAPAKIEAGSIAAPVTRPNGAGSIPVYAFGTAHGDSDYALHGPLIGESNYSGNYSLLGKPAGTGEAIFSSSSNPGQAGFAPDNLFAVYSTGQLGVSIPDLRLAFQMQKFLEREASHGSRYQEQILAHFNTVAADSRLQRPEYLGGNRIPLNISQVVNQSQTDTDPLGDVGGISLTVDSHNDVEFSSVEHGFIIGVFCIRFFHSYPQGYERWWQRETRYDYAWPEFAHLTDQPVRCWEINVNATESEDYSINGIFGYQERYAEYKFRSDKVTGEMRPGISNSLASWHFADWYGNNPVYLSDEWIREDKSNVDRTLSVTSATANQVFADFYVQCRATRPLPVHSNPGLADHF